MQEENEEPVGAKDKNLRACVQQNPVDSGFLFWVELVLFLGEKLVLGRF